MSSGSDVMNARDYQHKRFRSLRGGGADESSASQQTSDGSSSSRGGDNEGDLPPRVVTPPPQNHAAAPDNFSDVSSPLTQLGMLPKQIQMVDNTMDGFDSSMSDHVRSDHLRDISKASTNVSSTKSPSSPVLVHKPTATSGGLTQNVTPLKPSEPMRYSLSTGLETNKSSTSTKLKSAHAMALEETKTNGMNNDSSAKKKNAILTKESSLRQDPNAYKIFILLLQPSSKIFELIQLLYSPNDTTIGNILEMIPANATEPTLGTQEYTGLCRPKTKEELTDKDMLASDPLSGSQVVTAKVTLGEILVAIPGGFSGPDVAVLSKQILANPKIVKLLKRADPLAPKKKRRTGRSGRHASTNRVSSSRERVHVMELHKEEDEEVHNKENNMEAMQKAMQHAAAEAAAANAAIPGGKTRGSITSERSVDLSAQESLDDSYTSWSQSFSNSFTAQSSICSGVSRRAIRRRERQARRMRILQKSAFGAFGVMVLFYYLDPKYGNMTEAHEHLRAAPMGLLGVFQCLFLLLTLYKVERFVNTDATAKAEEGRCPFLKAASAAMRNFKSRHAKKLQRPIASGRLGQNQHDELDISQRLKKFSLKTAAVHETDSYTGSL